MDMQPNLQILVKVDGKCYGKSGILHNIKEAVSQLKVMAEDIKHADRMNNINTTRICHFGLGMGMEIPSHVRKICPDAIVARVQRCEYVDTRRKSKPQYLKTFEIVEVEQ